MILPSLILSPSWSPAPLTSLSSSSPPEALENTVVMPRAQVRGGGRGGGPLPATGHLIDYLNGQEQLLTCKASTGLTAAHQQRLERSSGRKQGGRPLYKSDILGHSEEGPGTACAVGSNLSF